MRIIIAGAGEVGQHIAKMLSKGKHNIIVIDSDKENLKNVDSHFDLLTINGSASSISVLKEAKIKSADLFIAVTNFEDVNIVSAILAKKLGAKKTIARIDNKEHLLLTNRQHFTDLGIDLLICPEKLAAKEIVGLLKQTGTTEIFEFSDKKLLLFVIKLDENATVINKTLVESAKIDKTFNYRAVAITRNTQTIIPRGDDKFLINDLIYVITNKAGIKSLLKYTGKKRFHIHNIMIIGGSRIGRRTAKDLEYHFNIKLIEINKDKSPLLADFLEKTLVITGDGSNIDLLVEEGIKKMDAFIAVTGNSETNILSCLLAKKLGVKKTIAEIENIDYIDLAENIGIDTIINKKLITASHIFGFTMNAEVSSLKCLTGADAEVLEFVVHQNAKITKKTLKFMDFPEDAIIGGVVRGNNSFIAKGDTLIEAQDKVVVFALPSAIHKVEKFFN